MQNYEKINYRQKGKSSDGKLVKGFIQDAHNKLSSGTIPSKFETIIYKNQNFKAFGSSSGRFFDNDDEKPAPGQYTQNNTTVSTMDTSSVSLSKKGYGNGFASTTQRNTFQTKYLNSGPGPGDYDYKLKQSLLETRSTNLKGSSAFLNKTQAINNQHQLQSVKVQNPGPGEYDYNPKYGKSVTTYNSAFISKTKRAQYLNIQKGPGAGEYNIKRNLLKKKPYPHIGVQSSFSPPVDIESHNNDMKELTKFLDEKKRINIQGKIIQDEVKQNIGPGQYNSEKFPEFKSEHFRTSSSSNFKEGIRTRFGDFKEKEKQEEKYKLQNPGPGAYKVEEVKGFETHYKEQAQVNGPYFMSETKREPYGKINSQGPNTQIPFLPNNKKSFHLNLARKWV